MKKILFIAIFSFVLFVGCSSEGYKNLSEHYSDEEYLEIVENDFVKTSNNDKVNISLDSSTAAYGNIRRMIENGVNIPKDAVVIEQMINYFRYSYVNNTYDPLTSFVEIAPCPWNESNMLASIAVKAKDCDIQNKKQNNFVFLLDVSGSMYSSDKLPLMVEAFNILIDNLNDEDRISIVTYAGDDKVLLDGGFGFEKAKISAIISDIEASGSTNGSKGIQTAYSLCQKYYIEGGNNRVFLATDGDFNVGISSIRELESFISSKRESGIYLSVLGFGTGNYKSNIMETLASKGNGNSYYIDSVLEAKKVFVEELGGTLNTVAKDCKVQVELNKEMIDSYRMIGYENKMLTNEQFIDDNTDAGEIGASHTVICFIELELKENTKYEDLIKVIIKYKDPDTGVSKEIVNYQNNINDNPSDDFVFSSRVCEFGLILRDSVYIKNKDVNEIVNTISSENILNDDYRKEFYNLVLKYIDRK